MDDFLYQQIGQGALVLTVNKRLARHLQNQYDRARQDEGALVWPRAEIMSLSAWLSNQQGKQAISQKVLEFVPAQYARGAGRGRHQRKPEDQKGPDDKGQAAESQLFPEPIILACGVRHRRPSRGKGMDD